MRILLLTVYIKVYEGVKDGFHQLVVQRLQVVVPQLQPLQRVQVVKSIVLNGCDAGGGRFLGLLSFRMASYSLVVLKPEILYVLPVTLGEKVKIRLIVTIESLSHQDDDAVLLRSCRKDDNFGTFVMERGLC